MADDTQTATTDTTTATPPPNPDQFLPRQAIPRPLMQLPSNALPPPQPTGLPRWKLQPPWVLQSNRFGPVSTVVSGLESDNQNILGKLPIDQELGSSGYFQITNDTWRQFAPMAGVDINRFPTAMSAPPQVQYAVAQNIPLRRWSTFDKLQRQFPWLGPNMTLAQADQSAGAVGAQRYVMSPADRPHSEWGKPPSVPDGYSGGQYPGYLPRSIDLPQIMSRVQQMMPMMSRSSGFPMLLMLTAFGSFMKAQREGQYLDMQLQEAKWQMGREQAESSLVQELSEAGPALEAYKDNPQKLAEVMTEIANKYGDEPLRYAASVSPEKVHDVLSARDAVFADLYKTGKANDAALEGLKLQKAQVDLDAAKVKAAQLPGKEAATAARTDAYQQNVQSLAAHRAEQDRIARQKLKDAEKGQVNPFAKPGTPGAIAPSTASPEQSGSAEDSDTAEPPPDEPPEDTDDESQGGDGEQSSALPPPQPSAPSTTPSPRQMAAGPAPVTDAAPEETADATAALPPGSPRAGATVTVGGKTRPLGSPQVAEEPLGLPDDYNNMNDSGKNYARDYLELGDAAIQSLRTKQADWRPYVTNGAVALKNWMQQQAQKYKGDALRDRLTQVDPEMTNYLWNIAHYDAAPPTPGRGGGSRIFFNNMARALNPRYSEKNLAWQQKYGDSGGKEQTQISRIPSLANAGEQVLADLDELQKNQPQLLTGTLLEQAGRAFVQKTLDVNSPYYKLMSHWLRYNMDLNVLTTGSSLEGETMAATRAIPWYVTPDTYRDVVIGDAQNAMSRVNQLRYLWHQYDGQGDPIGLDPDAEAALQHLAGLPLSVASPAKNAPSQSGVGTIH
jgi:hypothetical protein